jgi:hypothetical protein
LLTGSVTMVHDGGGGHGGIDRIAAGHKHAQPRLCGQRMRGGNHIARKQRQANALE